MSKIEWTDKTWNPVTGCTKVSPGCANCYIERTPPMRIGGRRFHREDNTSTTGVTLHPERLEQPLKWKTPKRIFVNSMSDLFHEDVPFEFIDMVWVVMGLAAQHTFQILTKRPERMLEWSQGPISLERGVKAMKNVANLLKDSRLPPLPSTTIQSGQWFAHNAWLGVSVENQHWADIRIPLLLQTPAAVRFISYEPALKPVDFGHLMMRLKQIEPNKTVSVSINPMAALDLIIIGGESGPGARPFHVEWAADTIRQCHDAGIACFVKQLGSNPYMNGKPLKLKDSKGGDMAEWMPELRVREMPE